MAPMFQASLLACAPTAIDDSFASLTRHELGAGAWIDEVPGWLSGADDVFVDVADQAPWQAHERIMWDRRVDEPRLSTRGWVDPPVPVPAMAAALGRHYGLDLSAVSANLYRDGSDSVAWHGDVAGRYRATTIVAIVSLGTPRHFLVRPSGGGPSTRFTPGHGDLLVMGGTCQHTFEHAVPKSATVESRIALMFREPGVF
jgi:alkylated DNA repair dioxygenase AlkB